MSPVPPVKLPSGALFPAVGLGTWNSKPGEVRAAVKHALKTGYRSIDCAAAYGNETEVGQGIKDAIAELGLKREEIFVTSKLWNTRHHPEDLEKALRKTLSDLGLEYLDLYLIHFPIGFKRGDNPFPKNEDGSIQYDVDVCPTATYLEMEKMQAKGLVKDIGLSNYNSVQIEDILKKAKTKPATNQVECHPYFNQAKLLAFQKEKGISMTAYAPLGSPNRPWARPGDPVLLDDPKLVALAKKVGKTPAQVILRWLLQRGIVIIPKSVTPSRIEENFAVTDFELSAEDMEVMNSFDKGPEGRTVAPMDKDGKFRDRAHPHFPFNIEF